MTGQPPVPPQAADARHWAEQFAARFRVLVRSDLTPDPDVVGVMTTWFANAIEAGRAAGAAAEQERIRRHFAGLEDNTGRPLWACAQIDLLDGTAGEPGGDTP